ncbi:MAG: homoserine dehydrogenase [Lachnospiraceae bacterium]|nr:homoserine dehydrogenase [Lachnospiraceae bacterium]MDD7665313.1 homoserine dehydrogenase [Lachnospiraceae bacterium]MDY4164107.1 homoserine dehydrogenase [Lachnospiraceae bacterium]
MKAAIMGYGTIGSGVAETLRVNHDVIARRVGEPIELKKVLDLREFEGDPIQPLIVHDYMDIVNDPEIKIVVETMGGVEPAYTFVKAMLEAGKHVTTSNKALVADKGAELIRIAKEHKVNFMFEASVGGGIPIIRCLQSCLTGDVIEYIAGIVNGTTNYMMTEMADKGADFDDVLKEAQAKGFAEKDPTADIEGYDACRKIAILTSLVAGQQVDYKDIPTEGITHISADDIKYAKKIGRKVKLLATSREEGDTYACRVAPFLVDPENPLYNVEGVFNAVLVHGNILGDGMFYGSGAGKLPTASAVVGDMVKIAKHLDKNVPIEWKEEKLELADPGLDKYRFFVRTTDDQGMIDESFGEGVEYIDADIVPGEVGFITPEMEQRAFDEKAGKLTGVVNSIRLA